MSTLVNTEKAIVELQMVKVEEEPGAEGVMADVGGGVGEGRGVTPRPHCVICQRLWP